MKQKTDQAAAAHQTAPNGLSLADEISQLAYSYWDAEGRPEGFEMSHWLRAEAAIRAARGLPPVEAG